MISLAVSTYFDNPNHSSWSGFSSLKDLQDFVSLSVFQSKKHIGKTKLVCNKYGAEKLKGCGFDIIEPSLEKLRFHSMFWAYPKIVTYSQQNEPFIHIDLDALLWERPSDEILNAPMVFQHKELFKIHKGYNQPLSKHKEFGNKAIKVSNIDYAYCCGFAGGNDIGFFKELRQKVDLYLNTSNFNRLGYNLQNHFFEQFFSASLAKERGQQDQVKFLCGQEIYRKGEPLIFAHLWGESKKDRKIIDKCLERSKKVDFIEDIPKYFLVFPDNEERYQNAIQNIKKQDFKNAHIRDGVNPLEGTDNLIEELGVKVTIPIPLGSLGAYLAHRRLWKELKENEWSMVVEDDAYFRQGWKQKLNDFFKSFVKQEKPTVIKLCVFNNEERSNSIVPSDAENITGDAYRLKNGLSAVCYIANRKYFELLWEKCYEVKGKTQDELTQEFYGECDVYGFFPNLVWNAAELKSIRNELGGWSISEELLQDLLNFPKGTKMAELGSGEGTKHLVSHFNLTSIEQNESYLNLHHDNYIYAPIKNDWFDLNALKEKDLSCEILLVDAPFGASRRGVIDNFHLFKAKTVIFDDVNRPKDLEIALEFCKKYGYKYEIKGNSKQHLIAWAD